MYSLLFSFFLLFTAALAQNFSSIAAPSLTPSPSTLTASTAASGSTVPSSGTCSFSNIQIDPCLTATTWTLDLPSTEQLVRDSEAKSGITVDSLSITGLGTLAMSQEAANTVNAHYAYNDFVVDLVAEADGINVAAKTTINGEFDANLFMTSGGSGDGTFCMHMTSGSGAAHIETDLVDFDMPLTPDGGFVQDNYIFSYTCSNTKLTMQGTLNGATVVGPYVYNGNGNSTGTSPINCRADSCGPFDWEPLVQKACDDYAQAKRLAPNTRGYFGQVVNIVCAAAKSTNACCRDMAPYYDKDGCEENWAGGFDQSVFNTFLGPDAPDFKARLEQILNVAGTATQVVEGFPWWTVFKGKDFGTLYAGTEHFIDNLAGPFNEYITQLVSKSLATCDIKRLNSDLTALAAEHNALIRCAVVPGFTVERNRGDMSLLPSIIAQASVPVAAWTMRTALEVLHTSAWPRICGGVSVPLLRARGVSGNESEPSTSDLTAIAHFLNLTIPDDPAFAGDYRTWVPVSQPLVSFVDLPVTTRQILSNNTDINVELTLSDSSASVRVSADRSHFNGEAVVALSLAFPNGDFSTSWQYGNTSTSLFGQIAMIVPSTFPVGIVNEYLFVNSTNFTWANHLNETSVVNDGYNILFDAFDLTMSYESLPGGVSDDKLHLVDLISGVALPSTVDSIAKTINAVGVKGHGQAWGGGGVYAIGYKENCS